METPINPARRAAAFGGFAILLSALLWLVYSSVTRHHLILYDDLGYIAENPLLAGGLSWENVRRAMGSLYLGFWMPVTWISYMEDFSLFGPSVAAIFRTNAVIHALNALLVFGLCIGLCRELPEWRRFFAAAFVSLVFALHPLQVESVAWAAERKDVLCAFWSLLSLLAYARYAGRGKGGAALAASFVLFVLALASKPMAVTLPCLLLLLDFWPFGRFSRKALPRLILEKIPFFAASAAISAVTVYGQRAVSGLTGGDALPIWTRLAVACGVYVKSLFRLVLPFRLSAIYPHPGPDVSWIFAGISAAILIAITVFAARKRAGRPVILFGWLWFCIMLLPVSGILQSGVQAGADRFTYLALLGPFLALAFSIAESAEGSMRTVAVADAALVLAFLTFLTAGQVRYWQDTETLFSRAVKVTSKNFMAESLLGQSLARRGIFSEAEEHYDRALSASPAFPTALLGMADALSAEGRMAEALSYYQRAVAVSPNDGKALNNMAAAMARAGRLPEAKAIFEKVLAMDPRSAEAHYNLGQALGSAGDYSGAMTQFSEALSINPRYAEAALGLGLALSAQGRDADAVSQFALAVSLAPGVPQTHYNLGNALAKTGRPDLALAQFDLAVRLAPDHYKAWTNMGNVFLLQKKYRQAEACYQKALEISPSYAPARDNLAAVREKTP